jgi:site-specific recombinase XerD
MPSQEMGQGVKLTAEVVRLLFAKWLKECGYRKNTIRTKLSRADDFLKFSSCRVDDFRDAGADLIKTYLKNLEEKAPSTKKKLAISTKKQIISVIRQMFKCLYLGGLILRNPGREIEYNPKGRKELRKVLSEKEMGSFLDGITVEGTGLRNRALFELMYSSGLRVSEAANLVITDIDFVNRMILVRQGKWGKDRVVPVSVVAIRFLRKYCGNRKKMDEPVFLGTSGRMRGTSINKIFIQLLKKRGLYSSGLSAHSIRHSVATHLLSHGADLRYVQELLGHESIETTSLYTNELYENMKKIYKTYHPRENEYFREVDVDYLARLKALYGDLTDQKRVTERKRSIKRRWYEKKKALAASFKNLTQTGG